MALAFTTGMTLISAADSATDWAATRFAGSGQAPGAALDTTVFAEGTGSIGGKLVGNNWNAALIFDWFASAFGGKSADTTVDLTAVGSEVLTLLVNMTTPSVALTKAADGFYIGLSSSADSGTTNPTVYSEWTIGGSDDGTGGFRNYLMDTRKPHTQSVGGGSTVTITSSSASTDEVLTAAAHGLFTGQKVDIVSHTGSTPDINGTEQTITVTDSTHFTINTSPTDSTPINITVGGTSGTVAREGVDLTAVRRIFFGVRNIASVGNVKGENTFVDLMTYGRPIYTLTGDGSTVANLGSFLVESRDVREDRLFEFFNGTALLSCGMQFGTNAQVATTEYDDALGTNVIFKRHTYENGSGVVDALFYEDYYKISAEGAASFGTSVTIGAIVGAGDDRQGVLGGNWRVEDVNNMTFSVDFQTDIAHLTKVNLSGMTLNGAREGVLLDGKSTPADSSLVSVGFFRCGEVDPGSSNNGVEMLGITLIDPLSRVGSENFGLLWPNTTHRVKNVSVITTGSPATQTFMRHSVLGSFDYDAVKFFGDFSSLTLAHGENQVVATLADSYAFSNQDTETLIGNGTFEGYGQSITGDGGVLSSIRTFLRKIASPTGTAVCKVFTHSGSFGSTSVATGAALATSETIDVADLTGTLAEVQFRFGDEFTLVMSTNYVFIVEYSAGDGTNHIAMGEDSSSPGHGGNAVTFNDPSYAAVAGTDAVFEVHTDGLVLITSVNDATPDALEYLLTGSVEGAVVVINAKTLKSTWINQVGDLLEDIRVRYEDSAGALIADGLTNSSGIFSFSIDGALLPLTNARIIGRKKAFRFHDQSVNIPTTGFDVPITLQPDSTVNLP